MQRRTVEINGVTMRNVVRLAAAAGLVLAAGCGDGETSDSRGYTKAPLETPGLFIQAEAMSEMNRLGVPNRPNGEPATVPDSGG
jgi:hypothetical protein